MSFSVSKWVCPPPETFEDPLGSGGKVEWFRCLPYVLIHLFTALAFFYPITLWCLVVALVSYSIRMFSITAFYHRYFSHRSFKTSRIVQFIGAFIACSSGQRGPLWWAAHHRRHHKHSDTEEDVHSPHTKSFFWSHTLWFMTDYAVPTFLKEIPDWIKFKELRFLNRYDWIPVLLLGLGCYFAQNFLVSFTYRVVRHANVNLGISRTHGRALPRHICGQLDYPHVWHKKIQNQGRKQE